MASDPTAEAVAHMVDKDAVARRVEMDKDADNTADGDSDSQIRDHPQLLLTPVRSELHVLTDTPAYQVQMMFAWNISFAIVPAR